MDDGPQDRFVSRPRSYDSNDGTYTDTTPYGVRGGRCITLAYGYRHDKKQH